MKLILLMLTVAAAAFFFSAKRAKEASSTPSSWVKEPPLINLSPNYINLIFLGFRNVYDNFVSIWAIHYLASNDHSVYDLDQLEDLLLKISAKEHRRETLYMFSCFVLSQLGRPESCVPIINAGIEMLPHSWRLPLTLGFIYMEDLNDNSKAAIYYSACAERENSPTYVKSVARKLAARDEASLEDLENSLAEVLQIPEDSDLYKILKERNEEKEE